MNRKSILAIEKIIANINELNIITKDRDDNYFYDSYEMPIICGLVDEIDKNLDKISSRLKEKYNTINWNVIRERKHEDEYFGPSLKLGKIWELASGVLKEELYDSLNGILEKELRTYYTNYSNKMHEKAMKETGGKKYIYKTNLKTGKTTKIEESLTNIK